MAKFTAEDTNKERVSSYLLNGALIQLILATAFTTEFSDSRVNFEHKKK